MKKILSILLTIALVLSFAGCGAAKNESSAPTEPSVDLSTVECDVFAIKGPTGIGLVNLMKKVDDGKGALKYKINLVGSNDEIVSKFASTEADIAAVATNMAAMLNKTTASGVTVLAVNTLGVLSLVAKGEEITQIADLKGKTIYTTGQGANPEYISKYILEQNGLTVGTDVTLEFVTEPTELVAKVVANEKAIVIAPQPVATAITVKDANAKIVFDLNDEWEKVSDTELVMGCVIVRNEFLTDYPEAVEQFLKDYEASIKEVNSNVDGAAALCESYGIVTPAAVAKKAIPYCNIVFQSGKEMKTNLSAYLKFLFDRNPRSVGGVLPQDNFYYGAN